MAINTTKWTPELIPTPLPPNVDPELTEPYYRKAGEVIRTTAIRKHEAVCLDPECPLIWAGADAFPSASAHTSNTGHLTRLYYSAEYVMQINPLHPKHAGKVRMIVDHTAPDLPPDKQPLFAQREDHKQPITPGERGRRVKVRARKQEDRQMAKEMMEQVKYGASYPVVPLDSDTAENPK